MKEEELKKACQYFMCLGYKHIMESKGGGATCMALELLRKCIAFPESHDARMLS